MILPGINKQITQHFDISGLCSSQHPEIMKHHKFETALVLWIRRERGQTAVGPPVMCQKLLEPFPLHYFITL